MASKQPLSSSTTSNGVQTTSHERSYFEQQRDLLVQDIHVSMENVLQNINKLNRSLEGIISVGNEFSSVEALWSHFENVMASDADAEIEQAAAADSGDANAEAEGAER